MRWLARCRPAGILSMRHTRLNGQNKLRAVARCQISQLDMRFPGIAHGLFHILQQLKQLENRVVISDGHLLIDRLLGKFHHRRLCQVADRR